MPISDPVTLYERASAHALALAEQIKPDQLADPTPCAEWAVQDLLDHLVGGTVYLRGAIAGSMGEAPVGTTAEDFRAGREALLRELVEPGALERICVSPLGFEWSVAQATAGTFMDALVHSWDLATAISAPTDLDPDLVDACVAMFLPDMPTHGRAAGLVGPALDVAPDAPTQHRLLGAMGRRP